VSDQEYVSKWLRGQIQPVIERTGVIWVFTHHTAKPKTEAPSNASELSYLGLGSSEITNWAREVMVLRECTKDDDITRTFKLSCTKRGNRVGFINDSGKRVSSLLIRHAQEGIAWERAPERSEPGPFTVDKAAAKKGWRKKWS